MRPLVQNLPCKITSESNLTMTRLSTLIAAMIPALIAVPALAQQVKGVNSDLADYAISAVSTLPAPPQNDEGAICGNILGETSTPAGQIVQEQGWTVTAERPLGPLTAVSFIGTQIEGTSGSCTFLNGNVGLFEGKKLRAIVYGRDPKRPLIGDIRPLSANSIRILDGDIVPQPVADLELSAEGQLHVKPVAAADQVCGGTRSIPSINMLRITEARERLKQSGWLPVDHGAAETRLDTSSAELARSGFVEAASCAQTSLGTCTFDYVAGKDRLSVFTSGEWSEGDSPTVWDYDVSCDAG